MSYCVNCGVELNPGARECPLCRTPVVNPSCPVDAAEPGFFPVRREEVAPVSRREAALLLSAMLLSVAICCGLLNLVFYSDIWWSFFIGGPWPCSGSGSCRRCWCSGCSSGCA